jgi:uncharacterized integral membrane protein (TIGR02327 family)
MGTNFGVFALVHIITNLAFIGLAWWALQSLNFEKFLRKNRVAQARMLYILLAIALGSMTAQFFLDYLTWSQHISNIFQ